MRVTTVLFRCDGGAGIGLGHIGRCQALAAAFGALGWRCRFAVTAETLRMFPVADAIIVPAGMEGAQAVAAAVSAAKAECLVVDHYDLDASFERGARGDAQVAIAIDDLANRPHDCELIVDSNPQHSADDYAPHVAASTRLLLGPDYALLRPEFTEHRAAGQHSPSSTATRVLVTLGGADPTDVSSRVLAALPLVEGNAVNPSLVIGPAHPRRDELVIAASAVGVTPIFNPPDMAKLMAEAQMAVTAGGATSLELACLGIPMLVIVTAHNQRGLAEALARAGAAKALGEANSLSPQMIADAIGALARDRGRRRQMGLAGRRLVDGRGASRVADAVAGMLISKGSEVPSS
jgi:UDP-2,4-diacetamido-2,4,6-trideoxy-beta-L-altropyranose hydrolase